MSEFNEPWKSGGMLLAVNLTPEVYVQCPGIFDSNGDLVADSIIGTDYEENSGRIAESDIARIVVCVNFLAGIPSADLETILSDQTRWGYILREIRDAASFTRRLQGSREGEKKISEFSFECQPKPSDR